MRDDRFHVTAGRWAYYVRFLFIQQPDLYGCQAVDGCFVSVYGCPYEPVQVDVATKVLSRHIISVVHPHPEKADVWIGPQEIDLLVKAGATGLLSKESATSSYLP